MVQRVKILDCTLRDGGYYNNWDFPKDFVEQYLVSMDSAGVDFVELGYRFTESVDFKGAYAFTTEEFLESVIIPNSLNLGVMINASEFLDCDKIEEKLRSIFMHDADKSKIDLVRIACNSEEVLTAARIAKILKSYGYLIAINLMKVSELDSDELKNFLSFCDDGDVSILYFADSFGSMNYQDIESIVNAIRKEWNSDIGFHAHNNANLALSNCIFSASKGVGWIDSTILGMGRGAGNAHTEHLLLELRGEFNLAGDTTPLIHLIQNFFNRLKSQYKWGPNIFYHLAAKHGVHPSYVQEMLSNEFYSSEDIKKVILLLGQNGGSSFNRQLLSGYSEKKCDPNMGDWSPRSLIKGRDILLLGTGDSVKHHKCALERFVDSVNPVVFALNTQDSIDKNHIHYRVSCHSTRFLADVEKLTNFPQPLIVPVDNFPKNVRNFLSNKLVFNFGMSVSKDSFIVNKTGCSVPNDLVLSYALAITVSGGARRIFLAGFDGYPSHDKRMLESESVFQLFMDTFDVPILSILPTLYKLPSKSVYFPGLKDEF